jgi:hypothetical protein
MDVSPAPGAYGPQEPTGDDDEPTLDVAADPVLAVPPQVLARYNARVLDAATALRVAGQPPVRPTVYLPDRLLVSGAADDETREHLTQAAVERGLTVVPPLLHDERRTTVVSALRQGGHENPETVLPTLHELVPSEGEASRADAWEVLQTFRARVRTDAAAGRHVGLDHLLTAGKHISGSPFVARASDTTVALSSYGEPGWGGRQPVRLVSPPPARQETLSRRRPVVAVLDTGVGHHDWFPMDPETVVHRNPELHGVLIGLGEESPSEATGVVEHPLEGVLDPYSGHGTFIAGLIHQTCPDADILSIRVMPSEGAVPEHVLLEALNLLVCRQQEAQRHDRPEAIVDVVCLSLGYYHEQVGDAALDPLLWEPIRALGECGVLVVASAGNDATSRPMYPAAFTPYPGGLVQVPSGSCVPVISVGADNPNGTAALFSNAGPWVVCNQPGAAVVSTFPKFNASAMPRYRFPTANGDRSTIDPDDFSSGFGVWSGTSFAAPVMAGKLAQTLLAGATDQIQAEAMVARSWNAVTEHKLVARP